MHSIRQEKVNSRLFYRLDKQLAMLERDRRAGTKNIFCAFDSKALVWQKTCTEYAALNKLFPSSQPAN